MKLFVLILCLGTVLAIDYNEYDYEDDGDRATELYEQTSILPPPNELILSPSDGGIMQDTYSIPQSIDFSLTCEMTDNSLPDVTFQRVGEDSLGYNVQQNGNALRFYNIQPHHRGIYQCTSVSNGQIVKASTIIDVFVLDRTEVKIYPPEPQVVQVGDYVILKCRVVSGNSSRTLKWTRNDPKLLSDRVEEKTDGTILISNITAAEAGEYVCRDEYGKINETTTITIQQTLSIGILPNLPEITLVEGDKLNLYCFSEFSSTLKWYKLDSTDRYKPMEEFHSGIQYSATYIKHNVSQNDEGTYICRANNRNGRTEKQIKVLIRPKQNDFIMDSTMHLCENNGIYETNDGSCKCPIHFTGRFCEHFTPSVYSSHYKGNSYIELNSSAVVGAEFQSVISFGMVFRTSELNGLLVWYGQNDDKAFDVQDCMALAVVDGYLEFSLQLDGQEMTIKSEKRVDDGEMHQVVIKRDGKEATLQVGLNDIGRKTIESLRNFSFLTGNVFIGGAPNINKLTGYRYKQGFKGCIHLIQSMQDSSLQDVDIHSSVVAGYDVDSCSIFN
ncbi:basement membrane-specific heparan sulfate proteoglycan core protein-like [Sitodiplosis mosellana]|uniref:basement membrane-specific heparan sulfate proteoglycan core protein-like n=1 Tax=Sitodiplosis mosellana TaxID=263140 RepID=UPI0024437AB4|nr:basement membrane-specific heparan sulfate proteoglycan core protein-like [Sitodiplosis mosellana]